MVIFLTILATLVVIAPWLIAAALFEWSERSITAVRHSPRSVTCARKRALRRFGEKWNGSGVSATRVRSESERGYAAVNTAGRTATASPDSPKLVRHQARSVE
jgi:hypothetical protein